MNRIVLCLPLLFAMSCGNNSHTEHSKPDAVQVKSATLPADPLATKQEALKQTAALDLVQLGDLLPPSLNGAKRSNFSMNSNMGYGTAAADYEKGRKATLHLSVYDCAGDAGAQLYQSAYASPLNKPSETAAGYTRIIDLAGGKAVETFDKGTKATTLSLMLNQQVLAVLNSRNLSAEQLRAAAAGLGQ